MKNIAAVACLLLGTAAMGLLVLWLGRIYYFSGSVSATFAQLQMLGTEALMFGGTLSAIALVFCLCGFALLPGTGQSCKKA